MPSPSPLTALLLVAAPLAAGADVCPSEMVLLEGGAFRLGDGSAEAAFPAFCLDRTEVTAAAFERCAGVPGCAPDVEELACGAAATFGQADKRQHPINCVDWFDAAAYCRSQGKRLPSEAEWEWAARGQQRGLPFPWGDEPPARRACWDGAGNTAGKGNRSSTCAVAAHPDAISADGLHDLGGNVREWTSTPEGRFRVLRGGSWGDSLPEFLSAAFRGMNAPDERMELLGFRCAAAPLPDPPTAGGAAAARAGVAARD